jgi:hypothetical protein
MISLRRRVGPRGKNGLRGHKKMVGSLMIHFQRSEYQKGPYSLERDDQPYALLINWRKLVPLP